MSDGVYFNNELYHYGVKGMKWRTKRKAFDASGGYFEDENSENTLTNEPQMANGNRITVSAMPSDYLEQLNKKSSEQLNKKKKNKLTKKVAIGKSDQVKISSIPSDYLNRIKSKVERRKSRDSNELLHYGVQGMKWGVRRYQNADGTLTNAGKRHYSNDGRQGISDATKQKLKSAAKVGVALAVTAGVAAYVAKNPDVVRKASQYTSDKSMNLLIKGSSATARGMHAVKKYIADHKDVAIGAAKTLGVNTVKAAGKLGVNTGKILGKSLEKASDAAVTAAMTTLGTAAALKIADKYAEQEGDSEKTKLMKKVAVDSATAAIKAVTENNNNNNKSGSNKGGQVGKDVTDAIGGPSNKGIDRSGARYQALFKDSSGNQRDADTRATIKSMASAGYDIDQIEKYLELKHSYLRNGLHFSAIRFKRR